MKIVIIVNSYNRYSLLKNALETICDLLKVSEFEKECAICVFDAGSQDGSREFLDEFKSRSSVPIELIYPQKGADTSFSAGVNSAVELSKSIWPDLEYYLLYETDNQFESLKPLDHAFKLIETHEELAGVGFTVKKFDGRGAGIGMCFPRLWQFLIGPELTHIFGFDRNRFQWHTEADGVEWSYLDVVYTSPLLLRRQDWHAIKGMDTANFPFSDCDLDSAKRLFNLGKRLAVIKTRDVIHDNKEALSAWSLTRALYAHRGRYRFLELHEFKFIWLLIPILALRHLFEITYLLISRLGKKNKLVSVRKRMLLLQKVWSGYR